MSKNILIINTGSTSFKYLYLKIDEKKKIISKKIVNKIIFEKDLIYCIRVVYSGDIFKENFFIKKKDLKKLKITCEYSQIHNKISYEIIKKIFNKNNNNKIFLCFDDIFFKNIPKINSTLPIKNIKKYGFHGIANSNIIRQINSKKKIIVCHLGGGCSVSCIKNKKPINNSFGSTPQTGIISNTRCGDIDFEIGVLLGKKLGFKKTQDLVANKSGIKFLSNGLNMKTCLENKKINKFVIDYFIKRISEYISKYYLEMKGCDEIVFSGGIGVGSKYIRERILKEISFLFKPKKTYVVKVDEEIEMFYELVKQI